MKNSKQNNRKNNHTKQLPQIQLEDKLPEEVELKKEKFVEKDPFGK